MYNIAGVILAGGKSSRMGSAKPFLTVEGRRIIDSTLEIFNSIFDEILIVTDDKNRFMEFKDVKVIEDLVKGYGPLAGIYTGLKTISKDKAFFVACDMPFLDKVLIKNLLDISFTNDCDAVVPCTSRGIEPLHAVYSKRTVGIIEDLLEGDDLSIRSFFKRCNCKYIEIETKRYQSFFNVNTPEDLRVL